MVLREPESLIFDGKESDKGSIPVSREWLTKLTIQGQGSSRRRPCIVLGFLGALPPMAEEWAVIPIDLLEELWQIAYKKKLRRRQ